MDGVIDIEQARAMVADKALWPRIRDFLWDFASQIHADWKAELAIPAGLDTPRTRRYVLDVLGVAPCFHGFPKEDGSRLLLLDAATLESVAKWLGALACAESLRRVTDGATVRELKKELPGVYPEVFGYTAYFREFDSRGAAEAQRLEERVPEIGCGILLAAVAGLPKPLVSRLKFKLPKKLCAAAPLRETKIKYPVILKLLKLKFPEAYAICCS